MVNKRGRAGARAGAWRVRKMFFSFRHCSRRCFLCVDGELGDYGHTVMLLLTLRRLRRYSFVYLSLKCGFADISVIPRVPALVPVPTGNPLNNALPARAQRPLFHTWRGEPP